VAVEMETVFETVRVCVFK